MSNLTRFVLIVWVVVVFVLTSSYQASLTSMLTVDKLQPTVTSIDDLIKNGDYVGYQNASYVTNLLKKRKFDSTKFRAYNTIEEYQEALTNGSANGGVSAIVDELPYIKLFLARYPGKYTTIGPTYRTAGFGFVFAKGSPLLQDVSKAVLKVTEGDKMLDISKKWFGEEEGDQMRQQPAVNSASLTLDSFTGLFLVAGVSSSLALIIFLFFFLYENRGIIVSDDPILEKLTKIAKSFNEEKENSSKGLRNDEAAGIMMSDVPPSPAISIPNQAQGPFSQDDGFSTTEPGSPVRDVTGTPERRL